MPRPDDLDGNVTRRRALQVGFGAAASLTLAACSDDETSTRTRRSSTTTAAVGPSAVVPPPTGMVRTSWSTDPWTLGSYSFLGVGATPQLRATLAEPLSGGALHLAGEHVAATSPATVHGAAESGNAAADRILDDVDGPERIVVVGAGMAGATVARRLADAGHEVIVVEGRDRVGGRLDTVRPVGWEIPVERGASWVHDVRASSLAQDLADLGVRAVPFDYSESVLGPDGRAVPPETASAGPERALATALDWAKDQDTDHSLADALLRSGATADPAELDRFLRTEIITEYGADPDELSAQEGLEEGTEGDDLLVVGGYSTLVQDLLDGIPTNLGWSVAAVSHGLDGITVTATDGRTVAGDRAVVTVPLGVLQAGVVRFEPPLPAGHRDAVDRLSMGVLDKVWLRWDERWWGDHGEQWTRTAPADEPYVEWFDLAGTTGQPVLLGLVGGSMARTWAARSDTEVMSAAIESLQQFRDAGW
jgi:monoamine oxidase